MNPANSLTILRIVFIPLILIALYQHSIFAKYCALLVFSLAALTDFFDGRIARIRKEITAFGTIMDPIADKLLVIATLISFVDFDLIPAWPVVVVVARELLITSFRTYCLAQGEIVPAATLGKHKTFSQIITIIVILIIIIFQTTLDKNYGSWRIFMASKGEAYEIITAVIATLPYFLMLIVVVFSIISGIDVIIKNKNFVKKNSR